MAINVRREPAATGYTEKRIQGTPQAQYATARGARACEEGMHGFLMPDVKVSRAKKRTIAVQKSDREFNIGLLSGDPDYERPNGCRVSSSGDNLIINKHTSPWM